MLQNSFQHSSGTPSCGFSKAAQLVASNDIVTGGLTEFPLISAIVVGGCRDDKTTFIEWCMVSAHSIDDPLRPQTLHGQCIRLAASATRQQSLSGLNVLRAHGLSRA